MTPDDERAADIVSALFCSLAVVISDEVTGSNAVARGIMYGCAAATAARCIVTAGSQAQVDDFIDSLRRQIADLHGDDEGPTVG